MKTISKITTQLFVLLSLSCFSQKNMSTPHFESNELEHLNDANHPCISNSEYQEIEKEIAKNVRLLGISSSPINKTAATSLQWPLKPSVNLTDCGYYYIAAYVDLNPVAGAAAVKDWNCGTRTYDGHRGIDIVSWPFIWDKMDNNLVEVIAAASGTIVAKVDGNPDRVCNGVGGGGSSNNYITIQHADGSQALYVHVKTGSMTAKTIGQTVVTGEYLAIPGSAGQSSGQHLHFEVRSLGTFASYIDPNFGACNASIGASWWASQKPYVEPQLMKLATHDAWPYSGVCPNTHDTVHEKQSFVSSPTGTAIFSAFTKHVLAGDSWSFNVKNSSNVVVDSWNFTSASIRLTSELDWSRPLPQTPGVYTYEGTFNGVTCVKSFTILAPPCSSPTIITQPSSSTVCAGTNATFSIASSGATSYQWQVNTGSGFVNITDPVLYSGITTQTLIVNSPTSVLNGYVYRCSAFSGTCTTISNNAIITISSPVVNFASQNNVSCNAGNNGSASVTAAAGGVGPYLYNWSPGNPAGDGTTNVTGLIAGTWSCSVTDALSCITSQTFTITQPPAITLNVLVSNSVICAGNTATLTAVGSGGTGVINYTWTAGPINNTYVVSPIINTTYSVTAKDVNGCQSFVVQPITVNPKPIISVNSGAICAGQSFTMVPSGASTYTYSSGSAVVSPTTNTSYNVTGTSALGCVSSNTAVSSVTVNSLPNISVNSGVICAGQSFTMIPSGASTYTYSSGSAVVSPTTNTSYNVTGTSALGCVSSNTAVSSVTVNSLPNISVNSGAICAGQSFTMVPSGASTYTYSSGSAVVSPTTNTSYNVTGTSALGCVSSNTAVSSVTVNSLPNISVNSGAICAGQSFTMVPSGASTYTYSSGSAVVSPTTNTSYNVTGTSALGCVSSNTAVSSLTVNSLPIISVNSGAICAGQSFTMVPSGASTYTYASGSAVVSPTTNTSYNVTGTSALGCVGSNTAVSSVTVNSLPIISVNSGAVCAGQSFTMVPSGASTYTYSSGSAVVSPTTNTSYNVTGTSALGCVSSNTAISSLTVNSLPTISVNSGAICAGQQFTMTPSGASTYTYSSGLAVVSPTTDTSYNVTGTSALGCVGSNTAVSSVTVNSLPIISVNSGVICAGQSFTMVPSGASTYTYASGSAVVSPTTNTSYNVTGTSALGCVSSNTAVSSLTVNSLPIISVNSGAICAGQSFTMVPSGASTYTYSSGSAVVSPTTNTSYNVTGTSALGCVGSNTVVSSVTVNSLPTISAISNNTLLCSGETATLTVVGALTYTWNTNENTSNIEVSPNVQTTYSVNATDTNGCFASTTITQNVSVCTNIINQSNINSSLIMVYPNPNNGNFSISLTHASKVTITNYLGQVLINETYTDGVHDLNIENKANGIYYIKVLTDNMQEVIKVIKQ